MITLTDHQIKEIAENLEFGMRCFFNKKTGEIKSVINPEHWMLTGEELWEEELEEIEEHREDYIEFEGLDSRDSFEIMEDFTEIVKNRHLKEKLLGALNRPKPFQHFKRVLDQAGESRKEWFDFRRKRYEDWVREQMELVNREDFE